MDIVTLGAAIGAAKKNLNNVVAPVSASDAGKIATVDSNGKYQAAALTVGQGEVAVDSTLLVSGAAADAKVTGDKVAELKSALTQSQTELNLLKRTVNGVISFELVENEYVATANNPGDFKPYNGWSRTNKISCVGLSKIIVADAFSGEIYNAWYLSDGTCLSTFTLKNKHEVDVPPTAVSFVISQTDAQMAKLALYADTSLVKRVEDVEDSVNAKVSSVNSILPDENGNVTIAIPQPTATGGDYFAARKLLPSYYTALPSSFTSLTSEAYVDKQIASVPEGDTFIFVTDMHYPDNAKESYGLMLYAYKKLGLDIVIHGGDVLDADNGNRNKGSAILRQWTNDMRSCFQNKMLTAFGNHDGNWAALNFNDSTQEYIDSTIVPYSYVESIFNDGCRTIIHQQTDLEIQSLITSFGITVTGDDLAEMIAWHKLHFYYDDTANKTRHIIINKVDSSPLLKKYYASANGTARAMEIWLQLEWLYGVLASTPDDYHIVVTGHSIIDYQTNSVPQPANPSNQNSLSPVLQMFKLLSACKTNAETTVRYLYAVDPDTHLGQYKDLAVDFSSHDREGKIIVLCGHSHWDYSCVVETYNGTYQSVDYVDGMTIASDGILAIMSQTDAIGCANYTAEQIASYTTTPEKVVQAPMTDDTVTENSFNIVTITDSQVVMTRIGAGNDREYDY